MKAGMEVSVNGLRVGKVNPRQVLAIVFRTMANFNLWSYDALKILYVEAIKMTCELFKSKPKYDKKGRLILDKSLERFNALIKYTPKDRAKLLETIYNIILGDEKLGLLRGFGFSNQFGDNLSGDPEKHSALN